MKYAVVFEKAPNNYSAYVPDLPGCVVTGSTREDVEQRIREAISFHLDGLREDNMPIHRSHRPGPVWWRRRDREVTLTDWLTLR
jgi:predicted RNase H-like HicB family nuclease